VISTDRLHITPLSYYELIDYVYDRKGSVVSDDDLMWTVDNVLVPMSNAEEEDHIYYTFWQATRVDGKVVGDIGIKAPPDEFGVVEIGYFVFEQYRKKGYGTEMLKGLMEWIRVDNKTNFVVARVDPKNHPSIRVVRSNGFRRLNITENMVTFIRQIKF